MKPKQICYKALGILILLFSIIGGASIGVVSNYIPVKSNFAKNAWRSGIQTCLFFIPMIVEYALSKDKHKYKQLINWKTYGFLLVTVPC